LQQDYWLHWTRRSKHGTIRRCRAVRRKKDVKKVEWNWTAWLYIANSCEFPRVTQYTEYDMTEYSLLIALLPTCVMDAVRFALLVCLFVWKITFELSDNVCPRYLLQWFTLTLSGLCWKVKVKVIGQTHSSWSQDEKCSFCSCLHFMT